MKTRIAESRARLMFDEDLDDNEPVVILGHEFLPSRILKKMAPSIYQEEFEYWLDVGAFDLCEDGEREDQDPMDEIKERIENELERKG
jgi:hypothetical protein